MAMAESWQQKIEGEGVGLGGGGKTGERKKPCFPWALPISEGLFQFLSSPQARPGIRAAGTGRRNAYSLPRKINSSESQNRGFSDLSGEQTMQTARGESRGIVETGWEVASTGEIAASLSLSGSLALVVWGPYSLDSSTAGVSKRSQGQIGKGEWGRGPLGFSPGFVCRAPPRPVRATAEVLGDPAAALLAADRAAPVELAVAAGHGLGAALLHR